MEVGQPLDLWLLILPECNMSRFFLPRCLDTGTATIVKHDCLLALFVHMCILSRFGVQSGVLGSEFNGANRRVILAELKGCQVEIRRMKYEHFTNFIQYLCGLTLNTLWKCNHRTLIYPVGNEGNVTVAAYRKIKWGINPWHFSTYI